jgi:hypothetical protein
MSEDRKGKNSQENSPWFGKKHSKESRLKMSKKQKGKHNSIETEFKKGQPSAFKGRKHSEESNGKNRKSHLGKNNTKEHNNKISKTLKGKYVGELNTMFGKHHSEETKQKMREARKRFLENKEKENING